MSASVLWVLVLGLIASATTATPNPSSAPALANAQSLQRSSASPPAPPPSASSPSTTAPLEGQRADQLPLSSPAAVGGSRSNNALARSVGRVASSKSVTECIITRVTERLRDFVQSTHMWFADLFTSNFHGTLQFTAEPRCSLLSGRRQKRMTIAGS